MDQKWEIIEKYFERNVKDGIHLNRQDCLISVSELFFGVEYERGDVENNFYNGLDCMTFVETSLSMALSQDLDEFKRNLFKIAYYKSKPEYPYRKHFAYADWTLHNLWLLEDRTDFEGELATIRKRINRAEYLAQKGYDCPHFLKPIEGVNMKYIPKASNIEIFSPLYIILFVSPKPGFDIRHMGFLIRYNSTTILRHSSQIARKVVDVPFLDYLYRLETPGFLLLKMKEDELC